MGYIYGDNNLVGETVEITNTNSKSINVVAYTESGTERGLPEDSLPEQKCGVVDLLLRKIQNLVGNSNHIFSYLCRVFGDREFTMLPTDGDEHMGGFRPYFVTRRDGRWVYKPRDMRADFFTLEMIRFANTIFPPELALPTGEIILLDDHTGLMQIGRAHV